MLISHPDQRKKDAQKLILRPFVFIHIPKCGGNSISAALNPYSTPGEWNGDGKSKHSRAIAIRKNYFSEGRRWNGYYTFTFIRNPWEVAHSNYHYIQMMAAIIQNKHPKQLDPYAKTFDRKKLEIPFIKIWADKVISNSKLSFPEFVKKTIHKNNGGFVKRFAQSFKGVDIVDRIFQFENLQADFSTCCKEIGFLESIELPHHNETILLDGRPRGPYQEDFTAKMRDELAEAHAYDIKKFFYEF